MEEREQRENGIYGPVMFNAAIAVMNLTFFLRIIEVYQMVYKTVFKRLIYHMIV